MESDSMIDPCGILKSRYRSSSSKIKWKLRSQNLIEKNIDFKNQYIGHRDKVRWQLLLFLLGDICLKTRVTEIDQQGDEVLVTTDGNSVLKVKLIFVITYFHRQLAIIRHLLHSIRLC